MNFLAHLYLARHTDGLRVGGFIADWVKGSSYQQHRPDIAAGILLHREIDHFADHSAHPAIRAGKDRLRELFRFHAGVVLDIVYDHFLAANWSRYSDVSLQDFAHDNYRLLFGHYNLLPERVQYFLPFVIASNRLVRYASLDGLRESLSIMSIRTSLPKADEQVIDLVRAHYDTWHNEFTCFFDDLQLFVNQWIMQNHHLLSSTDKL